MNIKFFFSPLHSANLPYNIIDSLNLLPTLAAANFTGIIAFLNIIINLYIFFLMMKDVFCNFLD